MAEKKKSPDFSYERKQAWTVFNAAEKRAALAFADDYRAFLSAVKTERETVDWAIALAAENRFRPAPGPGDALYRANHGGALALCRRGQEPLENGFRLVVAHADTPRLDLKPQPLFEEESLAFLRTHYYGGIKKYQWVTMPLALHGVAVLRDGTRRALVIGECPDDPVFTVTDLLPHLARAQQERKMSEAVDGEALVVLFGALPAGGRVPPGGAGRRSLVKQAILAALNREYGLVEEDLISAELRLVPAGPARDLGLDRSMIIGYGQDDRVCAYTALRAFFEARPPALTTVCLLVDREEIGSEGVDSIQSDFLRAFLGETFALDENRLRAGFSRARAISADVDAALDPAYRDVMESQNAPRLGAGVVLTRYTGHGGKYGASEASAEYTAWLRRIFAAHRVHWQTGELGRIDRGGGGTVAKYLARGNMETIDMGPPLLSMHSPWEVCHKADLYCVYRAYRVFYEN